MSIFAFTYIIITFKQGKVAEFMSQNKPVKICMITTIAKSFEWFVSDSAKNLADKGFDVTILCSDMDEAFLEKHQKFARCVHLPAKRGIDISSLVKSVRVMRKLFRKEKFDIVLYSTPNAAFYCALSAGTMKKSIRIYNQWGLRYIGFTGLKRFIFKMVEKYTCVRSTHVISTSPKNMQFNIDEGLCPKEKISVIGKGGTIGVDFSVYDINKKDDFRRQIREEYGIGENTFVFGFFGRLNVDKGLNELISAYRALTYRYNDTKLLLVGMEDNTNPPDEELVNWAKQSDDVIFTGVVPPSRVAQFMSASDLMVHPTYREGFSMVIQEAMAMALPVLTTDVPGPSEVIVNNETGILVPDHDDKALLQEMEALMNDPKRREKYSKNGRRRVELFFARPVMLQNIYTHYCRLLGIEDKHLKLMYLTANPQAAIEAENAGVDRIFLDLEILGKEERQGHLDTVVSHSSLDDVKKLRAVVHKAKLLVRCNPVHPGLKKEIDRIIKDGADIIMLPYFKTVEEVRTFLEIVNGRVNTVLLFETKEAVEVVDEILELPGIDEVYIGLNDLHLSYGNKFMFELLTNGTVEMLCNKFRAKGLSYGFGGIAKIGEGMLKSDYVIGEHKRLGSTCAILSRTFRNEVDASRPIDDFRDEFMLLRKREEEISGWSEEQFEENRQIVCEAVDTIVHKIMR